MVSLSFVADWGRTLADFVRGHEGWAAPVCFLLAFGESLAFVSILLPATLVLVAVGALIGQADLAFLPILLASAVGAALGDWLSFAIGRRFGGRIAGLWPLSRHPAMLPRARLWVQRWGVAGVFVGRFLGPLRATVPLVAGVTAMRVLPFQAANWSSAFLWSFLVLAPGAFGIDALRGWFG